MKRLFAIPMLAGLLAACATIHDTGWQGSGAKPFDTARPGASPNPSPSQPAVKAAEWQPERGGCIAMRA